VQRQTERLFTLGLPPFLVNKVLLLYHEVLTILLARPNIVVLDLDKEHATFVAYYLPWRAKVEMYLRAFIQFWCIRRRHSEDIQFAKFGHRLEFPLLVENGGK
jgi:hypothetical protein